MAFSITDFERGIDITAIVSPDGGDFNDLVDLTQPLSDSATEGKAIVLWSKDSALDTPSVPNPATNSRWKRYLWIRKPHSTATSTRSIGYVWDDDAVSDPTLLKWLTISPSTADFQAQIDAISNIANTALATANAAAINASNAVSNASVAITRANAAISAAEDAANAAAQAAADAASALAAAQAAQTTANAALTAANAPKPPGDGITAGSAFQQIRTNRGATAAEWFTPVDEYVKFNEQYAKNTDGQNAANGANVRQFNAEISDTGGLASVAAGVITLAQGTWYVRAKYASRGGKVNQGFLVKDSDNSTLLEGTSDWLNTGTGSSNHLFGEVCGTIVLAAATGVRVDHYFVGAQANGQGLACNAGPGGTHEVYATFEAWRIG